MADESLYEKIHDLSDLELALLLCFIAKEHCLISTPPDDLDDLIQELQAVARKTFGLSCAVINCDASTTFESFTSALLLPHSEDWDSSLAALDNTKSPESYFSYRSRYQQRNSLAGPSLRIANIVLAKNLDLAPLAVQIQALELLRIGRVFTRTAVHSAPKRFLFVPVLGADSGGCAHVTKHLNDFFLLAHWHDPEDGFLNLEDDEELDDDTISTGSVVKKAGPVEVVEALISETDIKQLSQASEQVNVDIDVTRYQMNIISFLRMHRAVADGMTPTATKHLERLTRCLAPLHKADFVTPALVGLAVKKVFLHRIRITPPEKERSMQWGSALEAVEAVLEDVGPEEVIEDVLSMVTAPL